MHSKIITVIFCGLLVAAFSMAVFSQPDEESIRRENREVSQMPGLNQSTVFSGRFAKDFEAYLNDKVAFRASLTACSKELSGKKGVASKLGRVLTIDKDMGMGTTAKTPLILYENTAAEVFTANPASREQYIQAVNKYARKMNPKIQMYLMVVPTQLEFMPPAYANIQSSQKMTIQEIYNRVDSRVKTVDAYEWLSQHRDEYIYFRTDHHWTTVGAYYGYRAFCEAAGQKNVDIGSYQKHELKPFLGTLYDQSLAKELEENPDRIEWYDVDPEDSLQMKCSGLDEDKVLVDYQGTLYDHKLDGVYYRYFMGGDNPITRIRNDKQDNGKTLLMIKDSYANAFMPWIIQNYEKIILIDPRSFWTTIEEVLDAYHIDDFLLLNYVFTTTFEDYCSLLSNVYDYQG